MSKMKTPLNLRFFFDAAGSRKMMLQTLKHLYSSSEASDSSFSALYRVACKYVSFVDPKAPERFCGLIHHDQPQTEFQALFRLVSVFVEAELGVPFSKIEGWALKSSEFGQSVHDDNKTLFLTLYIANAVTMHPRFNLSGLPAFNENEIPSCVESNLFKELFQWMYQISEPYGGISFLAVDEDDEEEEDKENAAPQSVAVKPMNNSDSSNREMSIIFEEIPDDVRMAEMELDFADEKLMKRVNQLESDTLHLQSELVTKVKRIETLEKDLKEKIDRADLFQRMQVLTKDSLNQCESKLNQAQRESKAARDEATAARADADVARAELACLQGQLGLLQAEFDELSVRYDSSLHELELAKKVVDDCRRKEQQHPGGDAPAPEIIVLREQISTYESRITTLTQTINEARMYPELVLTLETENAELAKELDLMARDVEQYESRIEQLNLDYSQAEERAQQAETRLKDAQEKLAEAIKESEQLKSENLQLSKHVQSQTASMEQMRQRIEEDEQYVGKLNEESRKLSIALSQCKDAAERTNAEYDSLKIQYSRIVDDNTNAAANAQSLREAIEKLTLQLNNKTNEVDRLRMERDDLQEQTSGFHRSFTSKNVERQELEEALVARQTELEGLHDKIRKAESKLELERDRASELRASLEKSVEEKKLLEKEISSLTGERVRLIADKDRLVKALENIQNDVEDKITQLADKDAKIAALSAAIHSFKDVARVFEAHLGCIRAELNDMSDMLGELTGSILPSLARLRQSWIDMHETMDTSRRYNQSLEEELNELRKQQFSRTPSLHDEFSELGLPIQDSLAFEEEHHSDPDSGHATAISSPEITPRDPAVPLERDPVAPPEADETRDIEKEEEVVETPVLNQSQSSRRGIFPKVSFFAVFLLIAFVLIIFQCDLGKIVKYFRLKYEVVGRVPI